MGKAKGKHRLDKYYRLAKERGLRSRASFKLLQLDEKFPCLHKSRAVLDLCAAPGSWMQIAVEKAPVGSLVLGIDLVPIAPVRGCVTLQQDITRPECRSKIKQVMEKHGVGAFNLVLHDGSPNVGGAWDQESVAQNALVIDSVRLATEFLARNGNLITKVFRSRDYNSVLFCLRKLFEKVEVYKPDASRSSSAETYLLGLKYKAPGTIDPRLLDYRYLFKDAAEPKQQVVDVLKNPIAKRKRDGYLDGVSVLRNVSSAADFIWSETPLDILGTITSISFDDQASLPLKEHDLTTEEIKILCDDLPVLGKNDFKHLLKWRMQMRKALTPEKKEEAKKESEVVKEDEENEENEDDKLLNELEELTNAVDRKKKQAKKLIAKRRAKDKVRKATGPQIDALEDGYIDNELFSLSAIKGKKDLMAVDNDEDDNGNAIDSDNEHHGDEASDDSKDSDIDSDEERQRYSEKMEEIFDAAYDRYIVKKDGSAKQRKRARQAHAEKLEEGDGDEEMKLDYDSDMNEEKDEANPLMIPLDDGETQTKEEISNQWFSQDIFAEAVEEGDLGKEDSDDEMPTKKQSKTLPKPDKSKHKATKASVVSDQSLPNTSSKKEDDFEIVPAPATDSDSDSSSDDDIHTKAEILACGKKMLRKKQREEMLDDAYNKYMFQDEGLPKWFVDDEKQHRQPMKPITKEEVNAMKAQFKEINARPAKKVAEAKARKKRAAQKRLEKVRKKANTISDTADIANRSKDKMIDKLYKKAAEPRKPRKELVVSKKGVGVKVGKGQKRVDRRMKSDARQRGGGKPGRNGKKSAGGKSGQKGKKPRGKRPMGGG